MTEQEALVALKRAEAQIYWLAVELRQARADMQKIAWLLVGDSVVTISREDLMRVSDGARVEWSDDLLTGGRKVRRVREARND